VGYFFIWGGKFWVKARGEGSFSVIYKGWQVPLGDIKVSVFGTLDLIDGYYLGIGFLFASIVG
jgi:hypothetical protein